jgi:hypothetical protein
MQLITTSYLQADHLVKGLETICCLGKVRAVYIFHTVQITILVRRGVYAVKDTNCCSRVKIKLEVVQGFVQASCSVLNFCPVVFVFVFLTLDLVKDFFHYS